MRDQDAIRRVIAFTFALVIFNMANGEAGAQSSRATTASNPKQTYAFFKSLEAKQPLEPTTLSGGKLGLGRVGCAYIVPRIFGPQAALLMALEGHAKRVRDLENLLSAYPRKVWEQDLRQFEVRTLDQIIAAPDPQISEINSGGMIADQMVTKLNEYRRLSNPSLPLVDDEGECGGFGNTAVLVDVTTIPNARRVQFIAFYFFELCKAQGYDPLDNAKCDRWTDLGGDINKSIFAGRVKFLVTWPDGQRTGPFDMDVDSLPAGSRGRSFTIRK